MLAKFLRIALIFLISFVLLVSGWTWLTLHWTYSVGERAGYVQKLSKKGWFCKTWEGEIVMITMPGAIPEKFEFTVPDDSVAERINALAGNRVVLHYQQHLFIPTSCFGETEYFVDNVRIVNDAQATLPPPSVPQGKLLTP